jgi:hypothetical protein
VSFPTSSQVTDNRHVNDTEIVPAKRLTPPYTALVAGERAIIRFFAADRTDELLWHMTHLYRAPYGSLGFRHGIHNLDQTSKPENSIQQALLLSRQQIRLRPLPAEAYRPNDRQVRRARRPDWRTSHLKETRERAEKE